MSDLAVQPLAENLFRRHVGRRPVLRAREPVFPPLLAHRHFRGELPPRRAARGPRGEAEIDELGLVRGCDDHRRRVDVAVDHPHAFRLGERVSQVDAQLDREVLLQGSAVQQRGERVARNELVGEVQLPFQLACVVKRRDVRVRHLLRQGGPGKQFLAAPAGGSDVVPHEPERDGPARPLVPGSEELAQGAVLRDAFKNGVVAVGER